MDVGQAGGAAGSDACDRTAAEDRRPYDTPLRRQQAAETRARIVTAGCAVVHELRTWDWRGLTYRAVAERSGLSERTVYRHFATERDLHNAVMRGLEDELGISYEDLTVEQISQVTASAFGWLSSYRHEPWSAIDSGDPGFDADRRRRLALSTAVEDAAPAWSPEQRQMVGGVLDVLWNPPAYERLVAGWSLDAEQATCAVTWAIDLLVAAMRDSAGAGPGAAPGGGGSTASRDHVRRR